MIVGTSVDQEFPILGQKSASQNPTQRMGKANKNITTNRTSVRWILVTQLASITGSTLSSALREDCEFMH